MAERIFTRNLNKKIAIISKSSTSLQQLGLLRFFSRTQGRHFVVQLHKGRKMANFTLLREERGYNQPRSEKQVAAMKLWIPHVGHCETSRPCPARSKKLSLIVRGLTRHPANVMVFAAFCAWQSVSSYPRLLVDRVLNHARYHGSSVNYRPPLYREVRLSRG